VSCSPRGFDGFPLWALQADLAPTSQLIWAGDHGDEALYAVSGTLEVDGRRCPPRGAVIVESGVAASVCAPHGARVVHVGAHDIAPPAGGRYGPPEPAGDGVHVIGPGGTWAAVEPGRETRMFADSTCPTCRITLFVTGRSDLYAAAPHRHSADEILFVLEGEVHFGAYRLGPGDAVAVAAGQRYGFRSGPQGFAFLNYRRDVSEQTVGSEAPKLEGGAARGLTPVHDVR
jgi:mannose-6-phosphate isomerase-like protein (cupin superfamily)